MYGTSLKHKRKNHSTKMDRYLVIYNRYLASVAIDEVKLKQFLSQTKIWDYARISEQDYQEMTATDQFALLQDYYIYVSKNMGAGIFVFVIFVFCFRNSLLLSALSVYN